MAPKAQSLPNIELLRFSFRKSDFDNAQTYFSQVVDEKRQLQKDLEEYLAKEEAYKSRILELQKSCEKLSEVEAANFNLKVSNAGLDEDVEVLTENAAMLQEKFENLEEVNARLRSTFDAELDTFQGEILRMCDDDGTPELKCDKDLRRRFGDISMVLQNKIEKLEREVADSRNKVVELEEVNAGLNCMLLEKQEERASSLGKIEKQILIMEKEKARLNCGKELEIACLEEKLGKLEEEVLKLKSEKTEEKANLNTKRRLSDTFEKSSNKKKNNKKMNTIREGDSEWSPVVLD